MEEDDKLQIKIDINDYIIGDFIISIYNPVNNSLTNINFGKNDIELNIWDETYHRELNVEEIKKALVSLINAWHKVWGGVAPPQLISIIT